MIAERTREGQASATAVKPYKGMAMEGLIAKWYAKLGGYDVTGLGISRTFVEIAKPRRARPG